MVDKLNILLLCTGDNQYHDHDKIGKHLKKILSIDGLDILLTDDLNFLLPENIKKYDVIVFYSLAATASTEIINSLLNAIKGNILNYRNNPVGFVGIHGATTSFQDNDEYKKMIGASFISHPDFGAVYDFIIKDKDHFITKDINDFKLQDELYLFDIHSDFNTLIFSFYEDVERPVAWYKQYGNGRVFYIALGHGIDQINNINFQKLVINGIKWASFSENE